MFKYSDIGQIIRFSHHVVSFLQIRGSIPVFWSQSGYKYRPPPRLTKGRNGYSVKAYYCGII